MAISIQGTTSFLEGEDASYKVALDGSALGVGDSIEFAINVSPVKATSLLDYSAIFGDLLVVPDGLRAYFCF